MSKGLSITDAVQQRSLYTGVFAYNIDDLDDLPAYLGGDTFLDGASQSQGGINPIYAHDPGGPRYQIVGFTSDPQELGETTLDEFVKLDVKEFLRELSEKNCRTMLMNKASDCARQDDLDDWQNIQAFLGLKLTNLDFSDIGGRDGDAVSRVTGPISYLGDAKVLPLLFAERAETAVLAEILKVVIDDVPSCGNCGTVSNGCQQAYALSAANAGSPGLSSQFYWSKDLFGTDINVADIAPLGGNSANDFAIVGKYAVVVSENNIGHYYAPKASPTADAWIQNNTGYVEQPQAIFSLQPRVTFVACTGGVIYKITSVAAAVTTASDNSLGTDDLNAIHGKGQTVVAVGDSNHVRYSINGGDTFGTVTGPSAGDNLTAVWVVDGYKWYIGNDDGELWYTQDRGATWTQRALPNQANIQTIWSLNFDPNTLDQSGAIAVQLTDGTGAVYRTITGGREWYNQLPGTIGLPANERIRSVSVCGFNTILAGGLDSGSSDGILAVAVA